MQLDTKLSHVTSMRGKKEIHHMYLNKEFDTLLQKSSELYLNYFNKDRE